MTDALAGRRLLDHPFYRRWERGEVSEAELASYAAQYRHFEAYLPGFLAQLVAGLPEGEARDLVAANLADESQSAEVALSKAEGLRTHYGMSDAAVSFWDHHAEVDVRHGAWAWDAVSSLTGTAEELVPALRAGAEAWWAFLDEREELAPAA